MEFSEIDRLYTEGLIAGRQGVVGALVVRPDGRIFAQRRSASRKTFPGCWDLVGGHLEPGETAQQALIRELAEETGWVLDKVLGLLRMVDWETPNPGLAPTLKREFVLAVTVQGDWDSPRLEPEKVTEGRWFWPREANLLNENRGGHDRYVYDTVVEFWKSPIAQTFSNAPKGVLP